MKEIQMSKVIGLKRYNTKTATLIADDVYWDGHNMDRSGRNTWLYRTKNGRYFIVKRTMWQGEHDTLLPVSTDEAMSLFEGSLSEHYCSYEEAFPEAVIEEA